MLKQAFFITKSEHDKRFITFFREFELVESWSRATNFRPTRKTVFLDADWSEVGRVRPTSDPLRVFVFGELRLVGSWSDATNFRPTRITVFLRRLVGSWSDATNFRPTRITCFLTPVGRKLVGCDQLPTNSHHLGRKLAPVVRKLVACDQFQTISHHFFDFGWPEVSQIRPTSDHPVGRTLVSSH